MSTDDLKGIIHSDPDIMGGTPVFVGTRVPLQNLIDSLEGGESIEDFLDGFPSVKREQVIAVRRDQVAAATAPQNCRCGGESQLPNPASQAQMYRQNRFYL